MEPSHAIILVCVLIIVFSLVIGFCVSRAIMQVAEMEMRVLEYQREIEAQSGFGVFTHVEATAAVGRERRRWWGW